MTNQEAYIAELEELKAAINKLLSAVPEGKTKKERAVRAEAERIAGDAIATISCMKNDYIPIEM